MAWTPLETGWLPFADARTLSCLAACSQEKKKSGKDECERRASQEGNLSMYVSLLEWSKNTICVCHFKRSRFSYLSYLTRFAVWTARNNSKLHFLDQVQKGMEAVLKKCFQRKPPTEMLPMLLATWRAHAVQCLRNTEDFRTLSHRLCWSVPKLFFELGSTQAALLASLVNRLQKQTEEANAAASLSCSLFNVLQLLLVLQTPNSNLFFRVGPIIRDTMFTDITPLQFEHSRNVRPRLTLDGGEPIFNTELPVTAETTSGASSSGAA